MIESDSKYTYFVNYEGRRVFTTSSFENVEDHYLGADKAISVIARRKDDPGGLSDFEISTAGGLADWRESLERFTAWSDKDATKSRYKWNYEKKQWDPLEESDGFHVMVEAVPKFATGGVLDRPDSTATLTLGQLKGDKPIDANVKTLAAIGKPVTSSIPPVALLALGTAMQDGVSKYGLFNWRETAVTSTVFYDAMMRHLIAWYSGEDFAPDSGIHHLAHLMAGAAIILDADLHKVLNDNRDKNSHKVTSDEVTLFKKAK